MVKATASAWLGAAFQVEAFDQCLPFEHLVPNLRVYDGIEV